MRTSPRSGVSRRFTQRSRVLFPDPDGPRTTTTSPRSMASETPFKTCSVPKDLWTSRISIIGVPAAPSARTDPEAVAAGTAGAGPIPMARDASAQELASGGFRARRVPGGSERVAEGDTAVVKGTAEDRGFTPGGADGT